MMQEFTPERYATLLRESGISLDDMTDTGQFVIGWISGPFITTVGDGRRVMFVPEPGVQWDTSRLSDDNAAFWLEMIEELTKLEQNQDSLPQPEATQP